MAGRAKTVYGSTRTWEKSYWAYAINREGEVVMVRCQTDVDAIEERNRMKQSNAVKVGCVFHKTDEMTVRKAFRDRGEKVAVIRDFKVTIRMA